MLIALLLSAAYAGDDVRAFPSGLHVLEFDDDRFPTISAALVVRAGFADAPDRRADLPHLVEHLVFRSTYGGERAYDRLSRLGCRYNGHTDLEVTSYELTCPSASTREAVDQLLSLLDQGLAGLTAADVALESRIVAHEYSYDEGWMPLRDLVHQGLYGAGHPYGRAVSAVLGDVTVDDAVAFAHDHYAASAAALVLMGHVDQGEVTRALGAHPRVVDPRLSGATRKFSAREVAFLGLGDDDAWFEDPSRPGQPLGLSSSRTPKSAKVPDPPPIAAATQQVTAPILDPALSVAWSLPGASYENWFQLEALGHAAYTELDDALPDRDDVSCEVEEGRLASTLWCVVSFDDPDDAAAVERAATSAFERPWTEGRKDRVLGATETPSSRQVLERDVGGVGTAVAAGSHLLLTDMPLYFSERYGTASKIDERWYLDVRSKWLGHSRAAVIQVTPGGGEAHDGGATPLASDARFEGGSGFEADVRGPISEAIAARKEIALDNGVRAVLVPLEGTWGTLRLVFRHPDGWATDFASLVDMHLPVPRRFDGDKTYFRSVPRWWSTHYSAAGWWNVPVKMGPRTDYMLRAMRGVFDTTDARPVAGKLVEARMARAARSWRTPSYWLHQRVAQALGGPDAWLGSDPKELERIGHLSAAQIQAYVDAKFRPEDAVVVATGAFDPADFERQVRKRLSEWKPRGDAPAARAAAAAPPAYPPETLVLAPLVPGSEAEIEVTCPLDVAGLDPGAREATERLLDELLQDAVWSSVRDRNGAAYVVSGWTFEESATGLPVARLSAWVAPADVPAVDRALLAIPAAVAGTTDGALAAARYRVLQAARIRASSVSGTAGLAEDLAGDGLGFETNDRFADLLKAAGRPELAKALDACAGHEIVGVVGDPAAVGAAFDAAGVSWEAFDWRAAESERVGRLPAAVAKKERDWVDRHQAVASAP